MRGASAGLGADRRGRPPRRPRRRRGSPAPVRVDDGGRRARCAALTDLAPLHQPRSLAALEAVGARAARRAGRRVLRHRVPRDAAGGGVDLRVPRGVARALGPPPVRLPRAVARVRVRGARPSCSAGPGDGAADRHLPPRGRRLAGRGRRRPLGRHDDGLHAARGARDGDAVGQRRPRARAVARRSTAACRRPSSATALEHAVRAARARRHGRHAGGARARPRPATPRRALALDVYLHRLRGGDRRDGGGARRARRARVHRRRRRALGADPGDGRGSGLGFLGVAVDPARNDGRRGRRARSARRGAAVRTFVVAAREDLEIAREVRAVLG